MTTPNIPWEKSQYVLDKEEKVVYLRGSFMRSMSLHHREDDPVPGYEIKLVHSSTIDKLKNDPDYIDELRQLIKDNATK